jgi:hypothetical protein
MLHFVSRLRQAPEYDATAGPLRFVRSWTWPRLARFFCLTSPATGPALLAVTLALVYATAYAG